MTDFRPRKAAAAIVAKPKAERMAELEKIEPGAFREWVKFYVQEHEQKLERFVKQVEAGESRLARSRLLEALPAEIREEVKEIVNARWHARQQTPPTGG